MQMNPFLSDQIWDPEIRTLYRTQFRDMIYMNLSHGLMLVKQGYLRREDFRTIADGLQWVENNFREEQIRGDLGDLYFNVMYQLYSRIGEATGSLIHLGRSRNDMCSACSRMQVRRELIGQMEKLNEVMELLLLLAGEHLDTIIPYNTFGQPAQPGTFGHYLMLVFQMLSRDYSRLCAAYRNVNRSPMGAAAGIGTSFCLEPKLVADFLGFDDVVEHSLDAVAAFDYVLETATAMAVMMSGCSKLAQDLLSWSSCGIGILESDDSIVAGSSIMPQKRNPVCFEHMRSQSSKAVGMLSNILCMNRNTTLFPNTEASVDVFCELAHGMEESEKVLELLKIGLTHSLIQKERAVELTRRYFTVASSVAEQLAQHGGVTFTDAHEVLHGTITRLMEKKHSFRDLSTDLLEKAFLEELGIEVRIREEDLREWLDPAVCLTRITTPGSPRPETMQGMIAQGTETLRGQEEDLAQKKEKLAFARETVNRLSFSSEEI